MSMEFGGKVGLVTGGGSGKAVTVAFSAQGAAVRITPVARAMTSISFLMDLGWTAR